MNNASINDSIIVPFENFLPDRCAPHHEQHYELGGEFYIGRLTDDLKEKIKEFNETSYMIDMRDMHFSIREPEFYLEYRFDEKLQSRKEAIETLGKMHLSFDILKLSGISTNIVIVFKDLDEYNVRDILRSDSRPYKHPDKEFETISFEELNYIKSFYAKVSEVFNTKMSRLRPALFYFQAGIHQRLDIRRLVDFCIVLESLFNTSPIEVAHQVRTRTAWFLGNTKEERLKFFELIRNVYNARSSLIHGKNLPGKLTSKILGLISSLENVVWAALRRIFLDDELFKIFNSYKDKEFDKYLTEMTL